jgi:hypothetical protein
MRAAWAEIASRANRQKSFMVAIAFADLWCLKSRSCLSESSDVSG